MIRHFGIIGVGAIADIHARAIAEMSEGELVACYDVNPERVSAFCDKHHCQGYLDLAGFLADERVEIVTICTPSGLHLDAAVSAAAAGKHLLVEKPLEITTARCDQVIQAAKKNNVLLSGIFPSRFNEASQLIKRTIDSGRLGQIVLADAYVKWFRTQEYYDGSGWRGTWALDGGGALMNQSIHAIDLLQWLIGPVSSICSFTGTLAHERIEVEDTAVATLKFINGALGVIEGSTGVYPGFPKKISISGSKGTITLEEDKIVTWEFDSSLPEDTAIREQYFSETGSAGGSSNPSAISYSGHQHQFENMVDAVNHGTALLIDGWEARKAVEIIEAIYRSANNHEPVCLN